MSAAVSSDEASAVSEAGMEETSNSDQHLNRHVNDALSTSTSESAIRLEPSKCSRLKVPHKIPSLSTVRAANSAFTSSYRPTALFVGATSGVGEGTARAFAIATKGDAHILICGRNKESAEKVIASFPKSPTSQYEFVQCDASLMKNVVAVAAEIKSKINTINYIVFTQGIMTMNGFTPTTEGIDVKFALHFYSRWKFVDELMPCLENAVKEGQEARVLNIFSSGTGAPLDTEDLGLKKNYTLRRAAHQSPTYNDLMVSEYSRRYPQISFIHQLPGFVNTSLASKMHWSMKLLSPIVALAGTSIDDCGQWMLYPLLSPAYKKGGYHLNQTAEPVPPSKIHDDEKARRLLVEHYTKEVAFN